jgi:hypothetical protein
VTAKHGADKLMGFAVDAKLSAEVEVQACKTQLDNALQCLALFNNYLDTFSAAIETKGINPDIEHWMADWHHHRCSLVS